MKKIIIFLFILVVIIVSSKENNTFTIPDESIRFRVVANSNEAKDQVIKYDLVDEVSSIIKNIETSNSYEESKININKYVPEIEAKLLDLGIDATVNFGNNYFPVKTYKGVVYDSGNYESLVITINEGKGDNWWCILFPPLCSLEQESSNIDDAEYSLYIKDIISKFY